MADDRPDKVDEPKADDDDSSDSRSGPLEDVQGYEAGATWDKDKDNQQVAKLNVATNPALAALTDPPKVKSMECEQSKEKPGPNDGRKEKEHVEKQPKSGVVGVAKPYVESIQEQLPSKDKKVSNLKPRKKKKDRSPDHRRGKKNKRKKTKGSIRDQPVSNENGKKSSNREIGPEQEKEKKTSNREKSIVVGLDGSDKKKNGSVVVEKMYAPIGGKDKKRYSGSVRNQKEKHNPAKQQEKPETSKDQPPKKVKYGGVTALFRTKLKNLVTRTTNDVEGLSNKVPKAKESSNVKKRTLHEGDDSILGQNSPQLVDVFDLNDFGIGLSAPLRPEIEAKGNNDNNGNLFINGVPFWKVPSKGDHLMKIEKKDLFSERLTAAVKNHEANKFKPLPDFPAFDESLDVPKLKTRDDKFFSSDRICETTLMNLVGEEHDEADDCPMCSNTPNELNPALKPLSFREPTTLTSYARFFFEKDATTPFKKCPPGTPMKKLKQKGGTSTPPSSLTSSSSSSPRTNKEKQEKSARSSYSARTKRSKRK